MCVIYFRSTIDVQKAKKELEENGWTVVENVIPLDECNTQINKIHDWLKVLDGAMPECYHQSLIHEYAIGHHEAAWFARIKVKLYAKKKKYK